MKHKVCLSKNMKNKDFPFYFCEQKHMDSLTLERHYSFQN